MTYSYLQHLCMTYSYLQHLCMCVIPHAYVCHAIFDSDLSNNALEIHNGKIHMYFVTSVLYEITCITSKTYKPDTDSNAGLCVLI